MRVRLCVLFGEYCCLLPDVTIHHRKIAVIARERLCRSVRIPFAGARFEYVVVDNSLSTDILVKFRTRGIQHGRHLRDIGDEP